MQQVQPLPFLDDKPNVFLADLHGYWERHGECDGCASGPTPGECCTKMIFPLNPSVGTDPALLFFFKTRGVEVKFWGDMPLAIVDSRCPLLTADGRCSVHGTDAQPEPCKTGPHNPFAPQVFPACSYRYTYEAG